MKTKQVIVMRTDLGMRKGKMVAQGAHASMAVLTQFTNPLAYPSPLKMWLAGSFTKICVGVPSLEALVEVYEKAKGRGVLCSIINDNGATEFGGVRTTTCAAIGPDYDNIIDDITGDLKLL